MRLGAAASRNGEAFGQALVGEEAGDGLGESAFIAGRGEQGGFAVDHSFRDARALEAGDGQADGLGLAEIDGEAFGVAVGSDDAGDGEEGSAVHEVTDNGGRLRSKEGAVVEGLASLGAERVEERAVADDEQFGGGVASLDEGHGADEMRAAFLLHQAADEEDDGVEVAGAQRVGREEVEVDSDGDGAEFRVGDAAFESLAADVVRYADEEARAGAKFRFAAQVNAAGGVAAKGLIIHRRVVTVEGDDERHIEP